ncbi:isoprenylcysteine carboxyl methyltransferase family protein [Bacillus sp. Marseille-P3661]|uniref:isoprenylcysteine carboxyl methyltransferase family protein n=1 Tax=Bacillus sp. Marseille-P3661 TaxID=1936234 RepID=UPI000C856779|nr:isoprenylcysteine carboxylmethyltransferase family protein [Bacillus sp. Marseille-P3661]
MFFLILITLLILQRLVELGIAKRNEKWMKSKGAIEVGQEHYKYIVSVHILFFISLLFEVSYFGKSFSPLWGVFFSFFVVAQLLRAWSLQSLGRFWNTKIIILPNVNIISKGPYKYIRHPNYLVVVIELLVVPLIFNAFWTALIFSVLNLIVLSIRIPMEEQALMEETNYKSVFFHRSRFTPSK